ncbi:MAG TPA: hypothetical protein VHZ78_01720 [Rhizomicrobium sp.]|jgi:hypothetical protein|nr:hypothetical protein [Rhizomicrobium sp.]
MRHRLVCALVGAICVLANGAAFADDVPLGDAAFTAYIRDKLQLYTPAPVRVLEPFSVAIGAQSGANLVYAFKPLHDACVQAPAQCADKVHDYVQGIVGRFPSAHDGPPPAELVPADKPGFMTWFAAELGHLLPADRIEVDGMSLDVTRPGGHVLSVDARVYYQTCSEANFICATALRQSLARTAAWLTLPVPAQLRVSLHVIPDCNRFSAADHLLSCKIMPSDAPMATFMRAAFANLGEICMKQIGDFALPMTNADRRDAGYGSVTALDACEAAGHAALGAFDAKPLAAGEIGTIEGPYAASRALFVADWAALAQRSGGHLLIALPYRDTLYYMTGDAPADVAALGARAQADFVNGVGISNDVYRWTGAGWVLATEKSAMPAGWTVLPDATQP